MNVIDAIRQEIEERKAQRVAPYCAPLIDTRRRTELEEKEFRRQVKWLKDGGIITIRETINSFAFYLTEESDKTTKSNE